MCVRERERERERDRDARFENDAENNFTMWICRLSCRLQWAGNWRPSGFCLGKWNASRPVGEAAEIRATAGLCLQTIYNAQYIQTRLPSAAKEERHACNCVIVTLLTASRCNSSKIIKHYV